MKLRDLEDVSSIFVTHEMNNLDYLCSEYAVVNEEGQVVFEKEGERLCLINSKVMMMREGNIIFSGTDETLKERAGSVHSKISARTLKERMKDEG